MKKKNSCLVVIVILLVILFICTVVIHQVRLFPNSEFEKLDKVDEIVIRVEKISKSGISLETLSKETLTDPKQINQIVSKTLTYSEDWQSEGFNNSYAGTMGRPVPVRISFFHQGEYLTSIGIGYTANKRYFLQGYGKGRYLNQREYQDLMDFFRIDTGVTYYEWEMLESSEE